MNNIISKALLEANIKLISETNKQMMKELDWLQETASKLSSGGVDINKAMENMKKAQEEIDLSIKARQSILEEYARTVIKFN